MNPESNIIADDRYTERRKEIDALIVPANRVEDSVENVELPCGKYQIEISKYTTGPGT